MKLNPNCIRDILLEVECNCDFNTSMCYDRDEIQSDRLKSYTHEEIIYHISQASKSNLISGVHFYDGGKSALISDLSPTGHEFLSNIRNDTIWKKVLSKGADASLPILFELAKNFALTYFLG